MPIQDWWCWRWRNLSILHLDTWNGPLIFHGTSFVEFVFEFQKYHLIKVDGWHVIRILFKQLECKRWEPFTVLSDEESCFVQQWKMHQLITCLKDTEWFKDSWCCFRCARNTQSSIKNYHGEKDMLKYYFDIWHHIGGYQWNLEVMPWITRIHSFLSLITFRWNAWITWSMFWSGSWIFRQKRRIAKAPWHLWSHLSLYLGFRSAWKSHKCLFHSHCMKHNTLGIIHVALSFSFPSSELHTLIKSSGMHIRTTTPIHF